MKAPENNQLTPPAIRTPEQGRPAQAVPPGAKPATDPRKPGDGIPEDIKRAGAKLSGHSLLTIRDMAREEKANTETYAAMCFGMAAAHRQAAANLERAGMSAKIKLR